MKTRRPILFKPDLIREILAGNKTETRRIVKMSQFRRLGIGVRPDRDLVADKWRPRENQGRFSAFTNGFNMKLADIFPVYGLPGHSLYVRETWAKPIDTDPDRCIYFADYPNSVPKDCENIPPRDEIQWKPCLHMLGKDSRIELPNIQIGIERLQAMTVQDAIAEGMNPSSCGKRIMLSRGKSRALTYRECFAHTWDLMYGGTGSGWVDNPWVWVIKWDTAEIKPCM